MPKVDVIIIGAGPAGLSAAIYSARAKLNVVVIDQSSAGGQVKTTHQVANYPGYIEPIAGHSLADQMYKQALKYGVKFELVTDIDRLALDGNEKEIELEDGTKYSAQYVIIATGRRPRLLKLPGEVENKGNGISYCATCDGEFYNDKDIFVIGGGNSAIEESLLLLQHVKSLTVIHQFDEFQAEKINSEKLLSSPKVKVLWSHEPRSFTNKDGKIEVEIENLKSKEKFTQTKDGVFIFVGMIPNNEILKGTGLQLNESGYLDADKENMGTNLSGVYAAGDIRSKRQWQITTAVADGTIAALEIVKHA